MDTSKVDGVVERFLQPMIWMLNLRVWQINVEYNQLGNESDAQDGFKKAGLCVSKPRYHIATITLNPFAFQSEKGVACTLLHELLHVVLSSEWELYDEAVCAAVDDRRSNGVLDTIYNTANERMIDQIELLLCSVHNKSLYEVCVEWRARWERDSGQYTPAKTVKPKRAKR